MKMCQPLVVVLCLLLSTPTLAAGTKDRTGPQKAGSLLEGAPSVTDWYDSRVITRYDFESAGGGPDPQGWTSHDLTDVVGTTETYFHVDDFAGLTGYSAIIGSQAMWCGLRATDADAADWSSAPGYGNHWVQDLVSREFTFPTFDVNVIIGYRMRHDLEAGFDFTTVDYLAYDDTWRELASYTGVGQQWESHIVRGDSLAVDGSDYRVRFRFRMYSDRLFSDEDGGYDSDGGVLLDELIVRTANRTLDEEGFEDEVVGASQTNEGDWAATPATPFGDHAALVDGSAQVQEGGVFNDTNVWGFFGDSPDSYDCGGFPSQPAVPLERSSNGALTERIQNEVRSPFFPIGSDENGLAIPDSRNELRVESAVYQDLPASESVFYQIRARFRVGGQETDWQGTGFAFFGDFDDWSRVVRTFSVPVGATEAQIALGVFDQGDGTCHSHSPLFDDVCVTRGFTSIAVSNINDGSVGSLRQAIQSANADPDTTFIRFQIPGMTPHLFQPFVAYDALSAPAIIDGYTQRGSRANSAEAPSALDGQTAIELDGTNTFGASGLVVGSGSVIRGIAVGNFETGIECSGTDVRILGSYVGLGSFGLAAPNQIGVSSTTTRLQVGSSDPADRNLISSNTSDGLLLGGVSTVLGNIIGLDPSLLEGRANQRDGIRLIGSGASGSTIGGTSPAERNVIAQNFIGGVSVVADAGGTPQSVTIVGNRIVDNSIGIDLGGDGATPNDPQDTDVGPNGLQNFPVLLAADDSLIEAELVSTPNTSFRLDFYVSDVGCTFGRAGRWIGSEGSSTDGSGFSSFQESITLLPPGKWITATATDPSGNTSELSNCLQIVNTMVGTDVVVRVPDESGRERVRLTFGEVFSEGNTYVETIESVPQPIPSTFSIGDSLFALSITTDATVTASKGIQVCVFYQDEELSVPESELRLLHFDDSASEFWVDITTSLDTQANVLCGTTNSFSPFVLAGLPGTAAPEALAGGLRLEKNIPNPFNPVTEISYRVPEGGAAVELSIFDMAGRRIRVLVSGIHRSGGHTVHWNGRDEQNRAVSSGIYFYRLSAGGHQETRKMVLLK